MHEHWAGVLTEFPKSLSSQFVSIPYTMASHYCRKLYRPCPARQNGDFGRNFAYFPLIFRLFSTYGTPSAHMFTDYANFRLFFTYFLWYPILIINSSICCPFAVFPPTCLQILLIFRLFSAYFLPKIPPIFTRPVLPGLSNALGCWEETFDTACRVIFIDTVEETDSQEQLISLGEDQHLC